MLKIGVDEVGRGALAGPIVACAFGLDEAYEYLLKEVPYLNDSKALTAKEREKTYEFFIQHQEVLPYHVSYVNAAKIDAVGIDRANYLAMQEAIMMFNNLHAKFRIEVILDGEVVPQFPPTSKFNTCVMYAQPKADSKYPQVMAASIIAKVLRDELMVLMDRSYPVYKFATHKGYGTAKHLEALATHGPCELHRKSFSPVANSIRNI